MNAFRAMGFALRSTLRWSLPPLRRAVTQADVSAVLSPSGRARLEVLAREFPSLASWSGALSMMEWRESLYALDVVSRHVREVVPGRGLDVGAKNGATLPGLATAIATGWDAVELDAHRRYLWGSTRRVYGESLAQRFADCRFIAGDVRDVTGRYAVITWFLPFLTSAPLEAWGLPDRFLAPQTLLQHVASLLVPGGTLLVINQGDEEPTRQRALFEACGLQAKALGLIGSDVSPFRVERSGWRYVAPR